MKGFYSTLWMDRFQKVSVVVKLRIEYSSQGWRPKKKKRRRIEYPLLNSRLESNEETYRVFWGCTPSRRRILYLGAIRHRVFEREPDVAHNLPGPSAVLALVQFCLEGTAPASVFSTPESKKGSPGVNFPSRAVVFKSGERQYWGF